MHRPMKRHHVQKPAPRTHRGHVSAAKALLPIAAVSRSIAALPDPISFSGPNSRTLGAVRFSAPLLFGGWMVALLFQGVLAPGIFLTATASGCFLSVGCELWLRRRQQHLQKNAISLWRYAERHLGPEHELTERARKDAMFLSQSLTLNMLTRIEERLKYTWELVRTRQVALR